MREYSVVSKKSSPHPSPPNSMLINPKSHWCTSKASSATLRRVEGGEGGIEVLCDFSQNILSMVVVTENY